MKYELEFTDTAKKDLKALPDWLQRPTLLHALPFDREPEGRVTSLRARGDDERIPASRWKHSSPRCPFLQVHAGRNGSAHFWDRLHRSADCRSVLETAG
jgi:hypothetical protein